MPMSPILYYSLESSLTVPAVPPAQAIIEAFADEVERLEEGTGGAHPFWDLLARERSQRVADVPLSQFPSAPVGPLLTTAWSQLPPYMDKCPMYNGERCWPGCVAIAMAQVMRYWRYPTTRTGNHCYYWSLGQKNLCADFASTTYDWANMPDKATSTSPQAVKDAVATLCYHCGVALDTQYRPRGSPPGPEYSTGSPYGRALTKYLGYAYTRFVERSDYGDSRWFDLLRDQISRGQPVLYRIAYDGASHLVVLDGCDYPNLVHLNMGWGGGQNGWYAIGTSQSVSDAKNWAVVDIKPHCEQTTYYVDGTAGDDGWDGTAPVHVGGENGPKKTIQAAIYATGPRDTVLAADGTYTGKGNTNLDFGARESCEGPSTFGQFLSGRASRMDTISPLWPSPYQKVLVHCSSPCYSINAPYESER